MFAIQKRTPILKSWRKDKKLTELLNDWLIP